MVLVIRRAVRKDERGVASTVGTIMALLVFLTFLSLIVNQYVPVWMKDSEASHMDGAVGQFADLKGAIDFQALGALMAQNAGAVFVPSTASTAVTLGIDGVPIFSGPTSGALTSSPSTGNWSVGFRYNINNLPNSVSANSSGEIDLAVANRYYPSGVVAYDNGAVIRSQSDGEVVVAAPVFQVSTTSGNMAVAFEMVNLYGSGSASGTSTQIIDTNVFGVNQQTYYDVSSAIQIRHQTDYALAWFNYFNSTLATSLKVANPTYIASGAGTDVQVSSSYYTLHVNTVLKYVELTINFDPSLPMLFTLQQVYVNVGIGAGSNMV